MKKVLGSEGVWVGSVWFSCAVTLPLVRYVITGLTSFATLDVSAQEEIF